MHGSSSLKAAFLRLQFLTRKARAVLRTRHSESIQRQAATTGAAGGRNAPSTGRVLESTRGYSSPLAGGTRLPQVSLAIERVLQRAFEPLPRGLLARKLRLRFDEVPFQRTHLQG